MFQLKRNDDNRDAWSVLFGRKSFFFGTRQNDEIALTIGLQDGSWGAKNPQILYLELCFAKTSYTCRMNDLAKDWIRIFPQESLP